MPSTAIRNIIDGKPVEGSTEDVLDVLDPATEEVIGQFAESSDADVDAAVSAARKAFPDWARLTPGARSRLLDDLGALLNAHAEELIDLEVHDAGKPVSTVRNEEMPGILESYRFFASAGRLAHGPASADYVAGHTTVIRREPAGVVAGITPWNFPLWQAVWKLTPALAVGNTVVVKPAENTPLSTLRLVELAAEVLPPGVVNLVNGTGSRAGAALVAHPGIDLVSFTGSIRAGRAIAAAAGARGVPVLLELGGNSPVIVFDDADVERVVDRVVSCYLFNAGQECMSATRLIVQEGVYPDVVAGLIARTGEVTRIGDTTDPLTTLGPLISQVQLDRVRSLVAQGGPGADIAAGGRRPERRGFFFEPTIVTGAQQDSALIQEEIFGPVATVQRFSAPAEALAMANGVEQGLAGSVWTRDIARAMTFAQALELGNVWINTHMVVGPELPLGGVGASGFGKEGGQAGLDAFTRHKHVQVALA
jgi:betaine-aldehyde dehydrogenase